MSCLGGDGEPPTVVNRELFFGEDLAKGFNSHYQFGER